MDQQMLQQALAGLPLGSVQFHHSIDSTNDELAHLIHAGCPDLSLVVADEQTAGRGRLNRRWLTPSGAALAFSLSMEPVTEWQAAPGVMMPRLTALGALAVCQVLGEQYQLPAQIKWPNDVLVNRRKLAGVLVEAIWQGDQLLAVILGIGVNIAPVSVLPAGEFIFPVTSLSECLDIPTPSPDRLLLLRKFLERILYWRSRLSQVEFFQAWQAHLGLVGEWVMINRASLQADLQPGQAEPGRILGLEMDGRLRVEDEFGTIHKLVSAEVHLTPIPPHF